MKLLKAFIRTTKVDDAIASLRAAGAPGITITQVNGVGYGYEPLLFTLAPSEIDKTPKVAKIEVVCENDCVERLLNALLEASHTGFSGDDIVFITPVERGVKIRTGAEAPRSLDPSADYNERKTP